MIARYNQHIEKRNDLDSKMSHCSYVTKKFYKMFYWWFCKNYVKTLKLSAREGGVGHDVCSFIISQSIGSLESFLSPSLPPSFIHTNQLITTKCTWPEKGQNELSVIRELSLHYCVSLHSEKGWIFGQSTHIWKQTHKCSDQLAAW